MFDTLFTATGQTIYMVLGSTLFSVILGFIPAIVLVLTAPDGLKPNKVVYNVLDFIVNTFRSFPFIILLILVIPVTRAIVGTSLGSTAAIVPLTISAIPFVARVIENALKEVDPGLIEAAKSFGASDMQIIVHVYFKEAFPSIVSGVILAMISIVGYTAMAGSVGGGGLGDVAIRRGYQAYNLKYLFATSVILIVFVQIIQSIGNYLYKKLS
ncbi:methionine ABC transporter permease [Floccifex sp.]|uniref:methionine ABC transporter permease n=1 Tax=Floccifex sp. TaxID=2815810 RepID=UPI002A75BEA3|nr:methionine ABC transporter permease [Floccifex sp.]MDD7281608.1 ABC transporter permease [Erysipelotrichaceae bacterium]MDY2958384.1 methionine ABC transporter permease [Floccifex sp.]